jgi:hypothetical protein
MPLKLKRISQRKMPESPSPRRLLPKGGRVERPPHSPHTRIEVIIMDISEQCYEFAEHLFESASEAELSAPHEHTDAPEATLAEWQINRVEWSLACSAALEARRTGKSPASFLEQAARFFSSRSNEAGREVFHMTCGVSGGAPR